MIQQVPLPPRLEEFRAVIQGPNWQGGVYHLDEQLWAWDIGGLADRPQSCRGIADTYAGALEQLAKRGKIIERRARALAADELVEERDDRELRKLLRRLDYAVPFRVLAGWSDREYAEVAGYAARIVASIDADRPAGSIRPPSILEPFYTH